MDTHVAGLKCKPKSFPQLASFPGFHAEQGGAMLDARNHANGRPGEFEGMFAQVQRGARVAGTYASYGSQSSACSQNQTAVSDEQYSLSDF
jgi:hypothetical protein